MIFSVHAWIELREFGNKAERRSSVPYRPCGIRLQEGLLLSYELGNGISLGKTNAACVRVYHAPQIDLTEEEKKQAVVIRAGIPFVVIGNGMTYLHQISPDKDWTLPDDYDGTQQISHIIPHWEYRKK